jgi:hypothetical protein
MPSLHGGTPSSKRQPTSSWIHFFPGSFPSTSGGALQPDSGPYAASSVLRPASVRPLPWGSPDAPLRTASFMGCVQSPSLRCRRPSHSTLPIWVVLWLSFVLDGLLLLKPECTDCGSHFCFTRFNVFF